MGQVRRGGPGEVGWGTGRRQPGIRITASTAARSVVFLETEMCDHGFCTCWLVSLGSTTPPPRQNRPTCLTPLVGHIITFLININ